MICGAELPVCNKMLIGMKTSSGICVAAAFLLFVNTKPASSAVGELSCHDEQGVCNNSADVTHIVRVIE